MAQLHHSMINAFRNEKMNGEEHSALQLKEQGIKRTRQSMRSEVLCQADLSSAFSFTSLLAARADDLVFAFAPTHHTSLEGHATANTTAPSSHTHFSYYFSLSATLMSRIQFTSFSLAKCLVFLKQAASATTHTQTHIHI
jgi:hypothetical protein